MRGNPGTIIQLPDGRKAIIYSNQPLLQTARKVIIHLIDDDYNLIVTPSVDGKAFLPQTLVKSLEDYKELAKSIKIIGKVD